MNRREVIIGAAAAVVAPALPAVAEPPAPPLWNGVMTFGDGRWVPVKIARAPNHPSGFYVFDCDAEDGPMTDV